MPTSGGCQPPVGSTFERTLPEVTLSDEVRFSMGCFGADTIKPTVLYSSRNWISEILQYQSGSRRRDAAHSLVERWRGEGVDKFRGNQLLKTSQAYPRQFGVALARVFLDHRSDLLQSAAATSARALEFATGVQGDRWRLLEGGFPPGLEGWLEADTKSIVDYLRHTADWRRDV